MAIDQCQKKMISFINMFGEFKTARNFTVFLLLMECTDMRKQEAAVETLIEEYPIWKAAFFLVGHNSYMSEDSLTVKYTESGLSKIHNNS